MRLLAREEVSHRINQRIEQVIARHTHKASDIHPSYGQLWKTLGILMMAGGKRMRPYLTYLAFVSGGGKEDEHAFQVAAAQEFLHFALLIHDDIIDRDMTRYGRKNISGEYASFYKNSGQDAMHYASGTALLSGDLALSQAYDLINHSSITSDKKVEITSILSQSMFNVAGGELLDMEAAIPEIDHADYFTIAQFKTASYSFVGPLLSGAVLAGATQELQNIFKVFGHNLGIAYQLTDDLIGLYGNEAEIGKPVVSDLREGKKTYLFELIQQLSSPEELEYFKSVWGNPNVALEDVMKVREIGDLSTAKERVIEKRNQYAQQALESISKAKMPKEYEEAFHLLIGNTTDRIR